MRINWWEVAQCAVGLFLLVAVVAVLGWASGGLDDWFRTGYGGP